MFRSQQNGHVIFNIPPIAACPCGSGSPFFMCCITHSGRLHKKAAITSPYPPKTGYSLGGCYASCLNDCNEVLSREHFISKSLLEYLNSSNSLRIGGYPWLNGSEKCLPPEALTSRILCQRYNNALSSLDEKAVRFFKSFDERGVYHTDHKLLFLFNGHDFERWILKVLCGMIFSGNYPEDVIGDVRIASEWIEILFGDRDFPNDQGLYICNDIGHEFDGKLDLQNQLISNKEGVSGIRVFICGYEFILSMSGFSSRRFDGRHFVYRPFELYTKGRNYEKSIIFSWDGTADLGTIHMDLKKNANV